VAAISIKVAYTGDQAPSYSLAKRSAASGGDSNCWRKREFVVNAALLSSEFCTFNYSNYFSRSFDFSLVALLRICFFCQHGRAGTGSRDETRNQLPLPLYTSNLFDYNINFN